MIPALTGLAKRFLMAIVSLTVWPIGFAVLNLITLGLIDLAKQSLNVPVVGGLTGIGVSVVLSIWVIGSSICVPIFIGIMFGTGGTAMSTVLGATFGSAASSAANLAGNAATSGVAAAASCPVSASSASSMGTSFARRPPRQT
jgi:hypothetical protein